MYVPDFVRNVLERHKDRFMLIVVILIVKYLNTIYLTVVFAVKIRAVKPCQYVFVMVYPISTHSKENNVGRQHVLCLHMLSYCVSGFIPRDEKV